MVTRTGIEPQGLETVAHAARHVDRLRRVQTRREHLTERLARAQEIGRASCRERVSSPV